jgi:hypothetical protein
VIPTGVLESLRQGSWNCSSYFLSSVAPNPTSFIAFAFIPTLSGLSDPLIPRAGLSYSQIIAVLSNIWWILSLPLQCSIGPNNISDLQSLVDSTPLLRALAILIDLLRNTQYDVASFWERCSGVERCRLTWTVLSDVDKLLDMFFVFVRPRLPSLRRAIDDQNPPITWTLINTDLTLDAAGRWLNVHEMQSINTLPQFVSLWERKMLDFWRDLPFRDRLHHTAVPECFLAPMPLPPTLPTIPAEIDIIPPKKPGKQPKDANKDRVERAQKPIVRWKANVPQSSRTAKDLFGVIADKRLLSQPHFPGSTLARDHTKTKICFGFCMEGPAGGCKKKPNKNCRYFHLDGASVTQTGPENFGSLTEFLQLPLVADKLEYTDTGRTLSES